VKPGTSDDPARVRIRVIQAITVASAVSALPASMFAPTWLLLFALPGAGFALLSALPVARRIGLVPRLCIAVATVIALSIAMYRVTDPPAPQAALTYLLLPPLAYAVLRRRPLDVLHSLFLALCLLLSAGILRGAPAAAHVAVFVVGSALVLQQEAQRLARSRCSSLAPARPRAWLRALHGGAVAAACALVVVGAFSVLRGAVAAAPRGGAAHVGLGGAFDLRTGHGPLEMVDDEMVEVRAAAPLPEDLYLRCEHYEVAGHEAWTPAPRPPGATLDLRREVFSLPTVPGVPSRVLHVRRLVGGSGYLYAPPGTHELRGALALRYDAELAAFVEPAGAGPESYELRYHDLTGRGAGRRAYEPIPGLTQVPIEVGKRKDYAALARELTRGVDRDPTSLALAIARGLQERCTYALEEPRGISRFALDNFLFGSRRGYCQHFATALAILLRLEGVPCRIASGLFGGTPDPLDPRVRVFGSRDAHAWVEIPLRGLGWVPFDATPAETLELRQPALVPAVASQGRDAGGGAARGLARWWATLRKPSVGPWLLLGLLLAVLHFRPARRARAPRPSRARAAHRALRRILAALARRGLPRKPGETLEHYAERLRRHAAPSALAPVSHAIAAYQEVRFGGRALDAERRAQMAAGLHAARAIRARSRATLSG
jgi:transglutaminase-like putative cysteine protease